MKNRILLSMFFITILAFFLRVYRVTHIPPAISWDEASIGYNAYSILKTGFDEHHRFFPLDTFVAFGDYKPPLSIYATVPSIAIFGLNEFAIRFPSVAAGTLAVFLVLFLVRELVKGFKYRDELSVVTSLLLAISPWHIQMSRAGFEANIAVTLVIFGTFLILKARQQTKLLFICWTPYAFAIYTFNSARYFVPIFGFGLLLYIWHSTKQRIQPLIIGFLIAGILLLPIIPHLFSPQARLRFQEVNIFSDLSVIEVSNQRTAYDQNSIIGKIFHNRRLMYARSYFKHFFDNLDPGFLFIRGDGNPKFSIQDVGELYIVELPFLLLGIYWVFAKDWRLGGLLLFWIVSAIIPASTARETPHALRIENSLPVWQIFIASGIIYFLTLVRKQSLKRFFLFVTVFLYFMNFLFYINNYYAHYAKEFSGEWEYGYAQALKFIQPIKKQYESIVMTDSIGRPYIYALFYDHVDPKEFWKTANASFDAAGFYNVYGFNSYHFIRGGPGPVQPKTLYILDPQFVPSGAHILKTIHLLNGNPILVIFDT